MMINNYTPEKYYPLTEEEAEQVAMILAEVKDRLPEGHAPFLWTMFNKVRNQTEPQPCTCASSGAHWGRCVNELRAWLKQRS